MEGETPFTLLLAAKFLKQKQFCPKPHLTLFSPLFSRKYVPGKDRRPFFLKRHSLWPLYIKKCTNECRNCKNN